jgi:hypothetical protein
MAVGCQKQELFEFAAPKFWIRRDIPRGVESAGW